MGSCFVLYSDNISNWWCVFMFCFVAFMSDDDKDEDDVKDDVKTNDKYAQAHTDVVAHYNKRDGK